MQLDSLQLVLLIIPIIWIVGLLISWRKHQIAGYLSWTKGALKATFKHAWQLFAGFALGYALSPTLDQMGRKGIEIVVVIVITLLVMSLFKGKHNAFFTTLIKIVKTIFHHAWLIVVGIAIAYFAHSQTLVTFY